MDDGIQKGFLFGILICIFGIALLFALCLKIGSHSHKLQLQLDSLESRIAKQETLLQHHIDECKFNANNEKMSFMRGVK